MPRDVDFNYTASDKTGDAAASVERRMRKTAETVKKDGDKLSSDFAKRVVKLADGVSPQLAAGLTRGFTAAADAAGPILSGGIVAAAPFAGAVLSSAIIGGIGLGGIVGGVALAAKDPRVQAAFSGMKTRVGAELTDAAQPFVDTTITGIGKIEDALGTIDFDKVFSTSARNAEPVIDGVASALEDLGDGIESVVAKSGPVMDQVGASIAELGEHTGDFLEVIGGGAEGAAAGLKDFTTVVTDLEDVVGPTVRGLTEIYGAMAKIGFTGQFLNNLSGPLGTIGGLLETAGVVGADTSHKMRLLSTDVTAAGTATGAAAVKVDQYGYAIQTAGDALDTFTSRVDNLAAAGRTAFDAATSVGAAMDAVTEAAKKNGQTLDANTEKGRANRAALSGLASALTAQYDAAVKVNGEGPKTDAIAAANRESFVKLATSLTGSKKKAEELATSLGLIPPAKTIKVTANTHDAEGRLKAAKDALDAIRSKTVTLTIARKITGSKASDSALQAAIDKNFDAGTSFRFAGPTYTGGEPARATMAERLDNFVTVELDGQVIYSNTQRQVREASKRDAWRQRVGTR